jgi:hypothetical protein
VALWVERSGIGRSRAHTGVIDVAYTRSAHHHVVVDVFVLRKKHSTVGVRVIVNVFHRDSVKGTVYISRLG